MKPLNLPSHQSRRGNVLLITMIFCVVAGIVLASLLGLIQTRAAHTMRSQAWNSVIPVLEAGIEEALTHFTCDSNSLTANSWLNLSAGVYRKSWTNFSDGSYYITTLSNATAAPIIISQGFVPAPLGRGWISRTVQVTTAAPGTTNSLFTKAILSRSTINFAGDMQVNSFNSADSNYSNPDGTYNPAKTLANGNIASMAGSGTAIDIAGAKIYGGIQYPIGATYIIGSGSVGDTAWVNNTANLGKIEPGYSDNTLNVSIPDAPLPPTDPSGWLSPPTNFKWTNGVTYAYVLTDGNWSLGTSTFHNQSILVLGNANLYVAPGGRFVMGSSDVIKVANGAYLNLYNASTGDAVFTGVANDSGLATHFYYWGLNSTSGSKLSLTGNGSCACAIYAPWQNIILTGSSSSLPRDFIGAIVGNTVKNSGHFYMSYDQALGASSGSNGAINAITSYREL